MLHFLRSFEMDALAGRRKNERARIDKVFAKEGAT
jgi:hypothetical protein